MGTTLYDEHGLKVHRFSGGVERGVCYSFHASGAVLTEAEVLDLLRVLGENIPYKKGG